MIINAAVAEQREGLFKYLQEKQYERVLDVGGAMFPWARKYVTHYLDIINPHEYITGELNDDFLKRASFLHGNINEAIGWKSALDDCQKNGKFDFAICSHTLEDIRNPILAIKALPLVAKEGFIAIPHKYRELSYIEGHSPDTQKEWGLNKAYIGYCHHRWIFSVFDKDGTQTLRLFPKLEFLSCVIGIQELLKDKEIGNELSFYWKDNIPFEIVNDDYLGPNPPTVFNFYCEKLAEGI